MRRSLKFRIAQAPQEAHADRDSIGLFGRKHQRREIKAAPQDIAEPGGALDRHAARLQRGDVAINRAGRHFELVGKRRCGHRSGGCLSRIEKS